VAVSARAAALLASPRRVVELGSGTGVVGLALAAAGHDVTLTDTPTVAVPSFDCEGAYEGDYLADSGVMRALRAHAAEHARAIDRARGRARVAELTWGDAAAAARHAAPNLLVVGSDVTYERRAWPSLLATLGALLSGGGGACLLALQERATPARAFYRAAEAAGWACDELQRDDARRVALVELTRTRAAD